jgi:16S rRNA (guanine(966)-N(2))-methyltransferase RsmD
LRVISGTARGLRLATPADRSIRPTADRVKEALFSIIASRWGVLADCSVLDLFAGTGSLGIEALSRGAGSCLFIDSSRDAVAIIRKNLQATDFRKKTEVLTGDVLRMLANLAAAGRRFDLVFADPPYGKGLALDCLALLGSLPLLAPVALVTVETDVRENLPARIGGILQDDRRCYGDTALTFFAPID